MEIADETFLVLKKGFYSYKQNACSMNEFYAYVFRYIYKLTYTYA